MFGAKPGSWYLESKKDPRWNAAGRSSRLVLLSGLPDDVKTEVERLKALYGEPPDDLEWAGRRIERQRS